MSSAAAALPAPCKSFSTFCSSAVTHRTPCHSRLPAAPRDQPVPQPPVLRRAAAGRRGESPVHMFTSLLTPCNWRSAIEAAGCVTCSFVRTCYCIRCTCGQQQQARYMHCPATPAPTPAQGVEARTSQPWHAHRCLGPFAFYDVRGAEAVPEGSASLVNRTEASFVLDLFRCVQLMCLCVAGGRLCIQPVLVCLQARPARACSRRHTCK